MKNGKLTTPGAIILAGVIIAVAILFANGYGEAKPLAVNDADDLIAIEDTENTAANSQDVTVNPVDENDHIKGPLNAPVIIVEYSDFECPFCGRVHPTLGQVVEEYDGQVAWVYRHLPLSQIHANADAAAQASECVAELGGNDAFWSFADGIFDGSIGMVGFAGVKAATGVDLSAVQNCVNSGKYAAEVKKDSADAAGAGGRGTPFAVVIGPDGKTLTVSGAQPIAAWRQVVDQLLAS